MPIVMDNPIAFGFPMDEIVLDGDLGDWSEDMIRYPIKNVGMGDLPTGKEDFSSNFRIGYNVVQNAIYIGMEVVDQSIFINSDGNSYWDAQDGLELYLDLEHLKTGSPITQYAAYGEDRLVFGDKTSWENVRMKKKMTNEGMTVEWRIDLDQRIVMGSSIGLDLGIIDRDKDETFSWISWGKGTQKLTNPERCGTILFVDSGTLLGTIEGKVGKSNLPSESQIPISLRISKTDNPRIWVQTMADSLGNYMAQLPLGQYTVDIPSKLVAGDEDFYRIANVKPMSFSVKKGISNTPPKLEPQLAIKPDLIPKRGILHDFSEERRNQVDEFVRAYQKFYNIPGVSLALIKDGKMVYHKTYGVKNTKTGEPVDEKTLFEAASITKPVFAFVVLRLADKGIIDLDRPLYKYYPFEALEEKFPEYKKMTARHVLIHKSGLPNWGVRLENVPGERYGYSGEGFEYLKRVVVQITGKPIEQLLDEELINPFGLYHMEFSDSEELRKVVSSGHQGNQPTNWEIPKEAGMAFSMHTEAKAFSDYALTLLEQKGLKPETYKEFMTIHTESTKEYWNDPEKREGAGLGIFIRESDYGDIFNHGGNNGDFKCLFEVYQDLRMGYVCFTNSETGSSLTQDLWRFFVEGK